MGRIRTSLVDDLISAAWWVNVILAGLSYTLFKYVIPAIWGNSQAASLSGFSAGTVFQGLAQGGPSIANWALLFFLVMAVLSFLNSLLKRKRRKALFEHQTGRQSLQSLSWQDFEKLVGEAYRRKGYSIVETGGGGTDGGVDLVLKKNGETIFCQCKHWKMERVGVIIVRELLGVVYDKQASGGIVITSGTFTQEARNFAKGNPIQLVDGRELSAMISVIKNKAQRDPQEKTADSESSLQDTKAAPSCPLCGSAMVLRTAKKGPSAGSTFYGCSTFPKCKGVLPNKS